MNRTWYELYMGQWTEPEAPKPERNVTRAKPPENFRPGAFENIKPVFPRKKGRGHVARRDEVP